MTVRFPIQLIVASYAALFLTRSILAAPVEATTRPSTQPAAVLIEQLLGDDAAARDVARGALLNDGDDALAALAAARASAKDLEHQVRLDTLLVQVKERADVGATHVTLQFTDSPLDEVLATLGKQSRTDFNAENLINEFGSRENLPKVTIDLRDASFWQAIRQLQESNNIVFQPQGDTWVINKNFGQMVVTNGTESGAFMFQPTMASYSRTIGYARNMVNGGEQFQLTFQAICEPKVRLAAGAGTITFDSALDSNNNDLLGAQRMSPVGTGNGQSAIGCSMQLRYPKNPGAFIREIRGTLRVSIARRIEQLKSEDLVGDRHLEKVIDGVKLRVEVTNEPTVANGVSFTAWVENAGDLGAMQRVQSNFQQIVHIIDSKGVPLRVTGFNMVRSDNTGTEFRATYISAQAQKPSGPYKLRIDIPSGFRELEVPFSMKDMKMP